MDLNSLSSCHFAIRHVLYLVLNLPASLHVLLSLIYLSWMSYTCWPSRLVISSTGSGGKHLSSASETCLGRFRAEPGLEDVRPGRAPAGWCTSAASPFETLRLEHKPKPSQVQGKLSYFKYIASQAKMAYGLHEPS